MLPPTYGTIGAIIKYASQAGGRVIQMYQKQVGGTLHTKGIKKDMVVVFAKQGPSEADLHIQEAEIGKGAVLSDPGLACKCN